MALDPADCFWIWRENNTTEGPVELPGLIDWVRARRVTANTFVYVGQSKEWTRAQNLGVLQRILPKPAGAVPKENIPPITGALQSVKLLADLPPADLADFAGYCSELQFDPFKLVVSKGEHGDAMYFVLDGALRAFDRVNGKEVNFCELGVGEYFGEIALLDQGPRSAFVEATAPSHLLRMDLQQLAHMRQEHPALSETFLYALAQSVTHRMRRLSKQYTDSMLWRGPALTQD